MVPFCPILFKSGLYEPGSRYSYTHHSCRAFRTVARIYYTPIRWHSTSERITRRYRVFRGVFFSPLRPLLRPHWKGSWSTTITILGAYNMMRSILFIAAFVALGVTAGDLLISSKGEKPHIHAPQGYGESEISSVHWLFISNIDGSHPKRPQLVFFSLHHRLFFASCPSVH